MFIILLREGGHVWNLFGHLVRKRGSQFSTLFILVDVSNHLIKLVLVFIKSWIAQSTTNPYYVRQKRDMSIVHAVGLSHVSVGRTTWWEDVRAKSRPLGKCVYRAYQVPSTSCQFINIYKVVWSGTLFTIGPYQNIPTSSLP